MMEGVKGASRYAPGMYADTMGNEKENRYALLRQTIQCKTLRCIMNVNDQVPFNTASRPIIGSA